MKSSAAAASAAARTSSRVAPGAPVGDVVGHRAREHEDVLRDVAHRAAQRVPVEVAHVLAVEQHVAGPRVVEAQHEPQQRGLAGPRGADDRVRLPRRDDEVDAVQDVGAVGVAGSYAAELDATCHGSRQRGGPGRHGDRDVEETEDARGGGAAPLVEVEDLGHLGERPEQALGHEHQHGVEADLEVAAQGRPAAEQEGAGEAGEDRHPDERHEGGRRPDRLGVGLAVGLRHGRHPVTLAVLGGEGLDRRDAGDVGRQGARQVGDRRPHPVVERLETTLEDERPDDDQRDREEGEEQQLPGRGGEDRTDEQDVEGGLQDRGGADVEEPLELVDVVVEGRERRARGPALVPAQVEVLDVVVGLDAQVVLDALGQAAPQHAGDVLAERLDHPHHGVDDGQPAELGEAGLDAEHLADERRVAADDDVDGGADQQLGDDVGDLVDGRGDDRTHEACAVGVVPAPELAQRLDGGGLGGDVDSAFGHVERLGGY